MEGETGEDAEGGEGGGGAAGVGGDFWSVRRCPPPPELRRGPVDSHPSRRICCSAIAKRKKMEGVHITVSKDGGRGADSHTTLRF